jgi:exodeoxyribonuclease VII small subunit
MLRSLFSRSYQPVKTSYIPFRNDLDEREVIRYLVGMSKTAPNTTNKDTASGQVPFEDALTQLESIVTSMESGDLPLEAMVARYEEGIKLSLICQARLTEAEQKIQQLEKDLSGNLHLKPLPASGEDNSF